MSTKSNTTNKSGILLDIGCGENPQPGYVGMDYIQYGNVDIVHNVEEFPWPLEDESVLRAVASHLLEHIEPHGGVFINFMNEVWRVLKPGAQFAFVVPYGNNALFVQDPTHCNPISETTLYYFDPDPEGKYAGQSLYRFYRPKPWKIQFLAADRNGTLECILVKRKEDPSFSGQIDNPDIVKETTSVPKHLLK